MLLFKASFSLRVHTPFFRVRTCSLSSPTSSRNSGLRYRADIPLYLLNKLLFITYSCSKFAKFVSRKKRSNTHSSVRYLFYAVRCSFQNKNPGIICVEIYESPRARNPRIVYSLHLLPRGPLVKLDKPELKIGKLHSCFEDKHRIHSEFKIKFLSPSSAYFIRGHPCFINFCPHPVPFPPSCSL
jgi:hypothetical protein